MGKELMKQLSYDTNPQAEAIQLDLIRKAPVYKRLQVVVSLAKTTRWLTWQALFSRFPDESTESRAERFITLLYDDPSLAKKVKAALLKRKTER
jgi:hypothetical protein